MRIGISIATETDGDVSSEFYAWLVDVPQARQTAALELVPAPVEPGDLGSVLEIIMVVLNSGFTATQLGVAFKQWRDQAQFAGALTYTLSREKDGRTYTVSGKDPDEVERKLDELTTT